MAGDKSFGGSRFVNGIQSLDALVPRRAVKFAATSGAQQLFARLRPLQFVVQLGLGLQLTLGFLLLLGGELAINEAVKKNRRF